MAETVANGVADLAESNIDVAAAKQQISQDDSKKQNGISNHKDELSNDSVESKEDEVNSDNVADEHVNGSKEALKSDDQSDSQMEVETEDQIDPQSENKRGNDDDDGPNDINSEDEKSNSSEAMEVDRDTNVSEENSNMGDSTANSNAGETKRNDSKSPSIVSEDSSRDSVDTIESKSEDSEELPVRQGYTVQDDEGGEFQITLNEDDKDTDDASKDGSNENEKKAKESSETKGDNAVSKDSKPKAAENSSDQTQKPQVSLLTNIQQPAVAAAAAVGLGSGVPTSLGLTGGQTFFIPGSASLPVGTQLVQQGSQIGYITRIGMQNIFVPVTNLAASVAQAQLVASQNQTQPQATTQPQQAQPPAKPTPPPANIEDLKPKSSLEMIELMKWEIQNRIPDNSNWSVAFHPKKEELSSITAFLLELGHDVVKESVYKDIIQIQTKKKDAGELKENEIESLDKMKTVYENTRKKVEHLQLENKQCNGCEFKTESATVMNWHKDFPHFDPSWDTTHGTLKCAHCPFKTKAAAQFSFHMSTIHNAEAKLPDKISCFQCELCPLNTTTKNKLDKHRQKCMKHFKLNVNLHPYYHDVNFCMKTCYYKPKKPPAPKPVVKPAVPAKPATPQPATPTMNTRKLGGTGPRPGTPQRPGTVSQMLPQARALQQIPPKSLPQPTKPASFSHPRPSIATARSSVPAAPRATPPPRGAKPQGKDMAGFEVCELCGGYVKDRHALRIHFYYAHKVEMPQAIFNRPERPLSCDVCKSKFWTTQGLTKHKSTLRHYNTPASSKDAPGTNQQCFMCMRKVANLFIHIENVHGMTMKDLVAMKKCIICGITATDRKNLEVHMASSHGVLIKANDFMIPDNKNSKPLVPLQSNPPTTKPSASLLAAGVPVGKNAKPSLKQNLCVFCQLQFADNIQLTMHCIKKHATCNACGMVVQADKNLSSHNCRQMKRHCDICGMRNISPETYVEHVKKLHMKPCKVEITKMSEDEIDKVKDKIKREYKPAIISLDSEEDSDVELVDSNSDEKRDRKDRSIENKENIEKPAEMSETSDADDQESKPKPADMDECSGDVKQNKEDQNEAAENDKQWVSEDQTEDVKPEVKQEMEESERDESNENSVSSRKRKASDSLDSDADNDEANKKIKVESDDKDEVEHSNGDVQAASDDGDTAMETERQVKDDPDEAAADNQDNGEAVV